MLANVTFLEFSSGNDDLFPETLSITLDEDDQLAMNYENIEDINGMNKQVFEEMEIDSLPHDLSMKIFTCIYVVVGTGM